MDKLIPLALVVFFVVDFSFLVGPRSTAGDVVVGAIVGTAAGGIGGFILGMLAGGLYEKNEEWTTGERDYESDIPVSHLLGWSTFIIGATIGLIIGAILGYIT